MNASEATERRGATWKSTLADRLHDPTQLRLFVIAAVLAAGYFAVYVPLSERIQTTSRELAQAERLIEIAEKMEQLQKQYETFEARVPCQTDSKEWVQYLLEGIRRFPLRLARLDCRDQKQLGPYKIVVIQVELEGSFFDMDKFLRWIESNHRLLRADQVRIGPSRDNEKVMAMQLTVLGVTS